MIDAIGQFIGDLTSARTDAILRFLVRNLNIAPSRGINIAIKVAIYVLLFIPIAIVVVMVLAHLHMYVGVYLINQLFGSVTS